MLSFWDFTKALVLYTRLFSFFGFFFPPTYFIWRRDSSQNSSQPKKRKVHLSRQNLWQDLLGGFPHGTVAWQAHVRTGVHENPWAFSLLFTWASVADPRLFAPCALDGQKHKSLHWTFNRHLPMVGLLATPFHAAVNRRYLGPELQQRQGLILDYSWPEVDSIPRSSWSLSARQKHWLTTLRHWHRDDFRQSGNTGWIHRRSSCLAQRHLPGRGWTNASPIHRLGCMQENLITMGNVGPSLLAECCYVVVKRNWVLRGLFFDLKAQVLSHLVHWMSSSPLCGWFVVCWVLFLFVCFQFEDIQSFAISPVLSQLENSWPTTDVLMTVRASSAHSMSYKKIPFLAFCLAGVCGWFFGLVACFC